MCEQGGSGKKWEGVVATSYTMLYVARRSNKWNDLLRKKTVTSDTTWAAVVRCGGKKWYEMVKSDNKS